MAKRIKRLVKRKEGLLRQATLHQLKIDTQKGRKDTTHSYWAGEKGRFLKQAGNIDKLMKKLSKSKKKLFF